MVIVALFLGFFSNIDIAADVEKARKFLLETGQDVTYENINLIIEKYVNEKRKTDGIGLMTCSMRTGRFLQLKM